MNRTLAWEVKLAFFYMAGLILLTAAAPVLSVYDPQAVDMNHVLEPPSRTHLLGTDELGRDSWSRLLHGGRVSLLAGTAAMIVSVIAGTLYGAVSGFAGGVIDRLLMRIVDALLSIPGLILMIGLQLLVKPGMLSIIFVISFTSWMVAARLIRTEIIMLKKEVFIQASTVLGASAFHLLFRHLLPRCWPTIAVLSVSGISHAILAEATLSFLGIGIPPHEPSWGNMLMGAQGFLLGGAWWLAVFPGVSLMLTILSILFIGDWLQDRLKVPHLRKESAGWKRFVWK
ncbi:ABC transporter permease [Domibacillus sp. PGB-M46]|uniref:ABC transporter permease n=1 Tax=Domibacillus sp. PGB-M46 TaxID=2910255 RepID=UPI001F5ACB19|nr:ABC transporter permease [Domibacillus sp. PGB-M46]MCI2255754.1 ABC transporter permease [Domibacillus sp. PGB-M46]